jgi:ferrochelatase
MAADGVTRAACFVTSAYSSYSSCRQYRENLFDAVQALEGQGEGAPQLDKLRHYFNHPGFVEPVVDATLAALADLPEDVREGAHLAFVTHSIPDSMAEGSGPDGGAYVEQHLSVAAEVVERVRQETGRRHPHALVYCSRSGAPHIPWLEPDINDHLERLQADGAPGVVMVPIGFVSDHMEVVYDLDTEARATAEKLGLPATRAATAGVDPRFVAAVRDLLLERAAVERGEEVVRASVGSLPACWDRCAPGCCPNPRGERPALAQA